MTLDTWNIYICFNCYFFIFFVYIGATTWKRNFSPHNKQGLFYKHCSFIHWLSHPLSPCIILRVSGQPHSAQESTKMRSLHKRGRETKKFLSISSSRLCLMGWGSSSLQILQVCSCADPGSWQLGTPVARGCCRGFLELYRVLRQNKTICYIFLELLCS